MDAAKLIGDPNLEIEQIEYDSRLVTANSLFVAVRGFKTDGYDFVPDAISRGAVAVMGERTECDGIEHHVQVPDCRQAMAAVAAKFYGYPGRKMKLCGVTGTNGKTTTCFLIKSILEARQKTTGLVTTSIYDTGRETFRAERTTPESLDLQRLLFLMKQNQCVNAVVEVSSHSLILNRVDELSFRVAVYTNITRDHLDFHGSMENYLKAKQLLIRKLDGPLSYAVINFDVPEFRPMIGEFNSSYIVYSLSDSAADVYCADFEFKQNSTTFDLVTPMGNRSVTIKLPGRFNLVNAVAAAAAGLASGVDLDNVIVGLEKAVPVPGRFEVIDSGQPFGVYVDFAHTPDAIARLCESARELTANNLYLLFGAGGDRDRGKRPLMGKAAITGADFTIVTTDNPRTEDPAQIVQDIEPGLTGEQYEIIPDRQTAIQAIINRAGEGDVVLLAGKGAEDYIEINNERMPFSDVAEARAALAVLGYAEATTGQES